MIDPKELRIGNMIHLRHKQSAPDEWCVHEVTVLGIHENGIQFKKPSGVNSLIVDLDMLDPIPITPEWLERLGFEKHDGRSYRIDLAAKTNVYRSYFIIHTCTWIATGDTPFDFYSIDGNYGEISMARFSCVHQLQNLYFALTGEELKIKEKV